MPRFEFHAFVGIEADTPADAQTLAEEMIADAESTGMYGFTISLDDGGPVEVDEDGL